MGSVAWDLSTYAGGIPKIAGSGSGAITPAGYADVVSLFASGSCSGFLKNDGTCLASIARSLGYAFGDASTGSALTTSEVGYVYAPFSCAVTGWYIGADAGTATVKVWRVNGGTALPTSANSINTSGVSLSTGTQVHSTTVTDFTSTAIAAGDVLGFNLSAVSTAKQITFQLDCAQ
jgi:hypothetical protein